MTEVHLVTGSSGFFGRQTIAELQSRGARIIGVDIVEEPTGLTDYEFHKIDTRDTESLLPLMKRASVVHNHAALVPLTRAYNDFYSVNVEGARSVAAAAKKGNVEMFLHTSSSAVFGKTYDRAIDVNTPKKPIEPYGRSKLLGEMAVEQELIDSDTQLAIIRPRTILGGERGGIFELFFSWISRGKAVFTVGNGENRFQFIHAKDLLDAYFLILETRSAGQFNVGTNRFGTFRDAIQHLINFAGSNSRIVSLPVWATVSSLAALEWLKLSPLAPWHYRTLHFPFFYDTRPLEEIGWHPKFSNNEMFESTYTEHLQGSTLGVSASASPHRKALNPLALEKIQLFFDRHKN